MLKARQFNSYFTSMVALYGAIYHEEALKIINYYHPEVTMEELLADLKKRRPSKNANYCLIKTTNGGYLIADLCFEECNRKAFKALDNLFQEQEGKDYYLPDSETEFLLYADPFYLDPTPEAADLVDFLSLPEVNPTAYPAFALATYLSFISNQEKGLNGVFRFLKKFKVEMREENLQDFLDVYNRFHNSSRLWANKGYTPNELFKKNMPKGPIEPYITLGPNLIKHFKSGEIDIDEYMAGVMASSLPKKSKQSLLSELLSLREKIKGHKA